MLEVTDAAKKQLLEYFKDREFSPIRIFVNTGGWAGPSLAMALDKPQDNDDTYKVGDLTFLAEKEFMQEAKPVKVDFLPTGFDIQSSIKFDKSATCGSCASASSSCG